MANNAGGSRAPVRTLTTLVGVVATILVGWVLSEGANILQPLVIAILLCNVLQPVVRLLRRFLIPSWVTVVLLLALLVAGMVQGGTLLYGELSAFLKQQGGWTDIKHNLEAKIHESQLPGTQQLVEFLESIDLTSQLRSLIGTVGDFFQGLFLVVIYMLFIFAEQNIFRRKIVAAAEPRSQDAERVIDSISLGIQRYLGVKTVTSLATGVCCYTVLLYLGMPYALLFGFATFLLNYIPTFGSFVASVFPISVALARPEGGLTDAIIVAATYLAVNLTFGTFLEPRLLGRELNLSPLVILVSVVVWAGLWGVAGTFLAVPLTATAQIILANIESTRKIAVLLSNGPADVLRRMREEGPGGRVRAA